MVRGGTELAGFNVDRSVVAFSGLWTPGTAPTPTPTPAPSPQPSPVHPSPALGSTPALPVLVHDRTPEQGAWLASVVAYLEQVLTELKGFLA